MMGKRKDLVDDELRGMSSSSPKKKHKHKHKKHKKSKKEHHHQARVVEEDYPRREKEKSRDRPEEGRAVKLKIKLGGKTLATTQVAQIVPVIDEPDLVVTSEEEEEIDLEAETETYQMSSWQGSDVEEPTGTTEKKKQKNSDAEEEEWLNALEAGELDDYGRIKQQKDVSMMTARQRAMLGHEIEGENQLLELPTETRRIDLDSEEAMKRRKQRAKKRKQQMQKQIEENKKQTVQKLLNKQAKKSKKEEEKARRKAAIPHIRYTSNSSGFSLSFPKGFDFPLARQKACGVHKVKETCAAQGCQNARKYCCASNKLPACSLECYQKVQILPPIPCTLTV